MKIHYLFIHLLFIGLFSPDVCVFVPTRFLFLTAEGIRMIGSLSDFVSSIILQQKYTGGK